MEPLSREELVAACELLESYYENSSSAHRLRFLNFLVLEDTVQPTIAELLKSLKSKPVAYSELFGHQWQQLENFSEQRQLMSLGMLGEELELLWDSPQNGKWGEARKALGIVLGLYDFDSSFYSILNKISIFDDPIKSLPAFYQKHDEEASDMLRSWGHLAAADILDEAEQSDRAIKIKSVLRPDMLPKLKFISSRMIHTIKPLAAPFITPINLDERLLQKADKIETHSRAVEVLLSTSLGLRHMSLGEFREELPSYRKLSTSEALKKLLDSWTLPDPPYWLTSRVESGVKSYCASYPVENTKGWKAFFDNSDPAQEKVLAPFEPETVDSEKEAAQREEMMMLVARCTRPDSYFLADANFLTRANLKWKQR